MTTAPSEITDEEDNFEKNEKIAQSFSDKYSLSSGQASLVTDSSQSESESELKYFCFSVRTALVYGFISHDWNGKAESPIIKGGTSTPPTVLAIPGSIFPCTISSHNVFDCMMIESCELPGYP